MKTKAILLLTTLSGIVIAVLVWVFRKSAVAQKTTPIPLAVAADADTTISYAGGGASYVPSGPIEFSNEFSNEFA